MRNNVPSRNRLILVVVLFLCSLTTSRTTCTYTHVPLKALRAWSSAGHGCYDLQAAKELCSQTADCSGITIQHAYCSGAKWTLRKLELNDAADGESSWQKGDCSDGGVEDNTDCPVGYKGLAGTDKCYKFDNTLRTEQEARTFCAGDGGKLPVVRSIEENAFIVKQTGWTGTVWIGQTKPTDDGAWSWEQDEVAVNTFSNWLNFNEPYLLPGELCSAIWTTDYHFGWNAAVCNLGSVRTVCEARRSAPLRNLCEYSYEESKILRAWSSAGTGCYGFQDAKALCTKTADCSGITMQPEYCGGNKWTLRKHELNAGVVGQNSWKKGACSDGGVVDNTDCPAGFTGLAGTNKCYHFDNNHLTQADAATFCQGKGGKLPVVTSIEENAFIVKQTNWAGLAWIDLQKPNDAGVWSWNSGSTSSFRNWFDAAEPTRLPGELCAAIWREAYNFAWNAGRCDLTNVMTICEAERIPQPVVECPAGFNHLVGTEKCYKNFAGQLGQHSWGQAKTFCEGMGAKLPVVTSIEENQFIVDQTGGVGQAWIAFSDQAQEGTWVWANGAVNAYTNWIPNEPQDFIPEENCATIWTPEHTFKWNGYPCSGMRGHRNIIHTVCEAKAEAPCPVHYQGGCSGSRGINKYQDKQYTVAECADKCRAETEPCVGFFIDNVRQECMTAKAGCSNNHDLRFKYYLIDSCTATEPEPVWDCPKTYDGGCSLGGAALQHHFYDRDYSNSECAKICHETANCAGYFLGKPNSIAVSFRNSCLLVTAGCQNDGNTNFEYHDLATCKQGSYTTLNYDVVLTGTGLDCNTLATELQLATATKLGVPVAQIHVDQSTCSRRRRQLSQEYKFTVTATIPEPDAAAFTELIQTDGFESAISRMLETAFVSVDGAEFGGFELEEEEPVQSEPKVEEDHHSVPIAASAGAVGGALIVGAYFMMKGGKKEETVGQDQV